MRTPPFRDLVDAGRQLAQQLSAYRKQPDALVMGLPRGGVVVASEISQDLVIPWDILLVTKIPVPGHEELTMGAMTLDSPAAINYEVVESMKISDRSLEAAIQRGRQALVRLSLEFHHRGCEARVRNRRVILADDGAQTGATMQTAIAALRPLKPRWLAVALPVASLAARRRLEIQADEVVCLHTPHVFIDIDREYANFAPISDELIWDLLKASHPVAWDTD